MLQEPLSGWDETARCHPSGLTCDQARCAVPALSITTDFRLPIPEVRISKSGVLAQEPVWVKRRL